MDRVCRIEFAATIIYWGYIGIVENEMETAVIYWGYIGIMEKERTMKSSSWAEFPRRTSKPKPKPRKKLQLELADTLVLNDTWILVLLSSFLAAPYPAS